MRRPLIRATVFFGTLLVIPLLTFGIAPVAARGRIAATAFSALATPTPLPADVDSGTIPLTLPSRTGASSATPAPGGPSNPPLSASRVEERTFHSPVLGRQMHYYVYLPQGYDSGAAERYPVVYLLHGIGGNADEWLGYGAREAADRLMNNGTIRPFILAFPHGEQGYFVDQVGGPQWATYIANDVVPEIDRQYRTLADRDNRAIGGLSMGAHGALQIALNHPDVFGIVGAHSPSFRPRAEVPAYFGNDAQFAQRDPVQLVAAHPDIARTLTIWLDYGLLDGFRPGQLLFRQALIDNDVPHQLREWDGDHSSVYWNAHLPEYLHFYSEAFSTTLLGTP